MSDTMMQLHGYFIEDLKEGMSTSYGRTVTETDIANFAGVSGDTNPLHLNEEFARTTRFKQRIAHGMLFGRLHLDADRHAAAQALVASTFRSRCASSRR